ncbi:MAG: ABC transporter permease [Bacteroidota bacterium]
MRVFIRLFQESIAFAIGALVVNRLRTLLSLLGITIGIFSIISVFTVVDAMTNSIQDSIKSLGENVIFVGKMPWEFNSSYPWWKYINRPDPSLEDLAFLQANCESAAAAAYTVGVNRQVSYESSNVDAVGVIGTSHDYDQVRSFDLEKGRYFTEVESAAGRSVGIIGAKLAEELFGPIDPIGRTIRIKGHKVDVIGVFEKEGESTFETTLDDKLLIPLNFARNFVSLRGWGSEKWIMVRAKEGITNEGLIDELTGLMRAIRRLRPLEDDNFALNQISMIANQIDGIFSVLKVAGGLIGFFAILVGGFGTANIMFVSVKERTHVIGIQKALGAKNAFILFQFLSEAVILCMIGGLAGLLFVLLGTVIQEPFTDWDIGLTLSNVLLGISISVGIGLVAGIIPAWFASRLNPVEAIRS